MLVHESGPKSLSNHLLWGTAAVRFIFMDEAGTSGARHEKTCVVAGVIVHADNQLLAAEALLSEALTSVPPEFAQGFVFHAEDIMNNDKYRDAWRLTDRVNLLEQVMSIPSRLGLPIAFGQCWSHAPHTMKNLKINEEHHLHAFVNCICKADQYMRDYAAPSEIATIVAERNDYEERLVHILGFVRRNPIIIPPGNLVDRQKDKQQGYNDQSGVMKISRIRRSVHFVGKNDDDLVWIADACAYGLKRYFSDLPFGEKFGQAITRGAIDRSDFEGPSSGSIVTWH